jgi:hypothetical protein|nr:MAG TPA: trimeric autotransporter-like protein [Crassvirales sp.]
MIDIGIIVTAVVGIITTFASGWTAWFFTRKKYDAEVDNSLLENLQKSLDFYRNLSDDNRQRLEIMLERNSKLEEEVLDLRKQVNDLTMSICLNLTCKVRQLVKE